jgi:hypothetical protein
MDADRPLLVVHDEEEGHLIYDLLLLLLDTGEETLVCFRRPVARFPPVLFGCRAFAVSGGSVLGVPYNFWDDTLFHDIVMKVGGYDFWEKQPSPRERDSEGRLERWWPMGREFLAPHEFGGYKQAPAVLPVADGAGGTVIIRMDSVIFDGIYCFDKLRFVPGGGGGWRVTPLPTLPVGPPAEDEIMLISAYLALGTRVWISVTHRGTHRGTFSLDIREEEGAGWRVEGAWQLPFEGRALHVPELGCVVGLAAETGVLCACEVRSGTPPVVRHVWRETFPWPWEESGVGGDGRRRPDSRPRDLPSLAYLGKGKFCICRPTSTMEPGCLKPPITYDGCSFLVVELRRLPSGQLELAKRGRMSYMAPPQGRRQCPYIGFIQPAIPS